VGRGESRSGALIGRLRGFDLGKQKVGYLPGYEGGFYVVLEVGGDEDHPERMVAGVLDSVEGRVGMTLPESSHTDRAGDLEQGDRAGLETYSVDSALG